MMRRGLICACVQTSMEYITTIKASPDVKQGRRALGAGGRWVGGWVEGFIGERGWEMG